MNEIRLVIYFDLLIRIKKLYVYYYYQSSRTLNDFDAILTVWYVEIYMRHFEMSPDGDYQEKMTESLYNSSYRYDLDHSVIDYLRTHMTNREPRELLEGYLSPEHVRQLGDVQDATSDYSGPYNTRYISSMIEALCVEGGTSQSTNDTCRMVQFNWNDISGQYRDLEPKSVRSEYARVREIARNNREDRLRLLVKDELAEALGI